MLCPRADGAPLIRNAESCPADGGGVTVPGRSGGPNVPREDPSSLGVKHCCGRAADVPGLLHARTRQLTSQAAWRLCMLLSRPRSSVRRKKATTRAVAPSPSTDRPNPVRRRGALRRQGALRWPGAAGALLAAAVATGGLTAPAAHASDGRTFTQMLAQLRGCESGGNYAINTGNGFYGAYQFDERTWLGVGGTGYPNTNPPAVQDEMATRLYEQRGWAPWPSCSRSLGLYAVPVERPAVGSAPVAHIDAMTGMSGSVQVLGWAFDRDNDPSATRVDVYVDGVGTPVMADAYRPDVAAGFGVGVMHGLVVNVPASPGTHSVCAYAINQGPAAGNPLVACASVFVPQAPVGRLDLARDVTGGVRVTGWALDPDTAAQAITVHVYVDGRFAAMVPADVARPDVAQALGVTLDHGYRAVVPAGAQVCTYGIDTTGQAVNTLLGCSAPQ